MPRRSTSSLPSDDDPLVEGDRTKRCLWSVMADYKARYRHRLTECDLTKARGVLIRERRCHAFYSSSPSPSYDIDESRKEVRETGGRERQLKKDGFQVQS
jgi:hypothetical protein